MTANTKLIKASSIVLLGFLAACASKAPVEVSIAAAPANTVAAALAPQTGNQIIPGSAQDFQVNVGDRVLFPYDRYDLDEQGREVLRRQAAWLNQYPTVTLVVEGHSDERGTREYNMALAARRAASVREYLTTLGLSASRLETMSYGKERPSCAQTTETCWAQNRRGQSVIKSGALS